ncbi:MAG: hypothetical protein M3443_07575 [Actinomycetota bacterium]|nr:hypothetical protein [Actinomycetota bacterium]
MLIDSGSQWPPPGHGALRAHWQSWRAWWSGDLAALKRYAPLTAPGGYWQRLHDKPDNAREVHLPLPSDIARTAGQLVAGTTPSLTWSTKPETDAWNALDEPIGWSNKLLEGFQTGSPLGGFYLRPAWDDRLARHPLSTVVPQDEALPEFRFGMLWQCTFVQELPSPAGWKQQSPGEVWRHLEHHEPGEIRHELWLGTTGNVGRPVSLTDHPTTAHFSGVIDTRPIRPMGDGLIIDYVPNLLPNPLVPMPLGKSDFQGGTETFFDMVDSAYDSWMRDIDLGKARILVAQEMLDQAPTGSRSMASRFGRGAPARAFDLDAKVFTGVPGMPMDDSGKPSPITPVQFKIRFQEHAASVADFAERGIEACGFAPQTLGRNVDGQLSGAAMRRRDHKSYRTQGDKRRYARSPIERHAETLMRINHVHFGGPAPAKRPELGWRDNDQSDPFENAQTIDLLRRGEAASTEVLVAMAQPELDPNEVAEEVARIVAERAAAKPAPVMTGFEPDEPE